jgi:transposase
MGRFVEGADRSQLCLLPECLDDWVNQDNPVHVIEAFVEALDLAALGFVGATPAATGRPAYHPAVLLKLYIYGYLNRVQSSRRLEREAGRNVELMWLHLHQLDSADRQEPSEAVLTKTTRLKEKISRLRQEMGRLSALDGLMRQSPDQQVSLTDPDARSMATSGRGSGVVGYNVQVAVETEHHLIVTHEVTNVGNDRAQLAPMAKAAQETLGAEGLHVIADRGYFNGEQIKACVDAGLTVTLPKPQTSGAKAEGRFGKQDFVYLPDQDAYRCPAGAVLRYHFSNVEKGVELRRYWSTAACLACAIKRQCTTSKERRITRWVHEHLVEEVQTRLDANPDLMRVRRETVEHPFGTIKARMGATHFLMKRLPNVAAEMALHVLAYNLTRLMNIMGRPALVAAMRAA